jgi:hypothetical protein
MAAEHISYNACIPQEQHEARIMWRIGRSAMQGLAREAMSDFSVSSVLGRPMTRWPSAHQVGFLVVDKRFFHAVQFQFSPQDAGDRCSGHLGWFYLRLFRQPFCFRSGKFLGKEQDLHPFAALAQPI